MQRALAKLQAGGQVLYGVYDYHPAMYPARMSMRQRCPLLLAP